MKTLINHKKVFNITLLSIIFIFLTSGCSSHRRLKAHHNYKHKTYSHSNYARNSPYAPVGYNPNGSTRAPNSYGNSYPQRGSYSRAGVSSRSNYDSYRAQAPLKIATNANEIDNQARSTKPMYIASQPMRMPSDVRFMNLSTYRNVMTSIINRTRASSMGGYPGTNVPVIWNRFLTKAAEAHARDMAVHKFISHLGSGDRTDYARKGPGQGSNFYERIIFYGYPAKPGNTAGEILTVTKDSIVGTQEIMPHFQHAIENFLKSQKHSYVLKNPRLNRVGVAAYRAGKAIYWVIELVEERS